MIDVRDVKPSAAIRLLNSTPLGEELNDRQLRAQMNRAGHRIGDGKSLDLLRYAGWLISERMRRTRAGITSADKSEEYERHRERMAKREAEKSQSGRDIAPIPPVASRERRGAAEQSLQIFCETYLAPLFSIRWSDDHLKVIARFETAILKGGLFVLAMPRASGKTTLVEAAGMWALLYGHRRFIALIGSAEDHAEQMLDSIKSSLQNNELLLADFPEVCYPIEKLKRIAQRAPGQVCDGRSTELTWDKKEIVLPTIEGSIASGAMVKVAGLTGQIRGMAHMRSDGAKVRPDLVIIDDPQTDESANSPSQCAAREALLAGAILGLAGPGKKISGFMPCTVIRQDDMADRILNRDKHPAWQGERMKLVYRWPDDPKRLWEQYAELRRTSLRNGGRGETATAFYRENRAAMDDGSIVGWEDRFNSEQLSAIQNAWDLRIDHGDRAFFSEYQNDPLPAVKVSSDDLDPDMVAGKINGLGRAELPVDASALTMFIDVQQKVLYWLIAAWAPDFTGSIVDYGTWPDQPSDQFTLSEVRRTIARAIPKASVEGGIYEALVKLCGEQLRREFKAANGATLKVSKCLVDANWGRSTEVVYQFARQGEWAGIVSPSHGKYYGASSLPFSEHKPAPGERIGYRWRIPPSTGRRAVRYVLFDTNWWKSFVADRMRISVGDRGSLALWGAARTTHRMFAEQMTAERRIPVEARSRKVDEWRIKQPGLDNHLFDCIVGAAVAASVMGITPAANDGEPVAPKRKIKLSELQARKRTGFA